MNNDHKNKVITLGMGKCHHELKKVTIISEPDMPSHIECKLCGAINVTNPDYFNPDNWTGFGELWNWYKDLIGLDLDTYNMNGNFIRCDKFAEVVYRYIVALKDEKPFASNKRLQEELKEVDGGES